MRSYLGIGSGILVLVAGCGNVLLPQSTPVNLFTTLVVANGEPVDSAIVDTGGGFDLILSDRVRLGVQVIDTVDILAFDGVFRADVTEPFPYSVAGFDAVADQAFVNVALCDCNALGFFFFRKSGAILKIDFLQNLASFGTSIPRGGMAIPFSAPPANLSDFDTSFMIVRVSEPDGDGVDITALVDTGSNVTSLRRGIARALGGLTPNRADILLSRPELGTVWVRVFLFDSPGIPDLVIGTDVMRAWSDEWHFNYESRGGTIHAVPRDVSEPSFASNEDATPAMRLRPFAIPR